MGIVEHYKAGIKAVARALESAPGDVATLARDAAPTSSRAPACRSGLRSGSQACRR